MPKTVTAAFDSRRDAETAVEHLVQEHGLPAGAVRILSDSETNTAGTNVAGSDTEGGRPKTETEGAPKLSGKIRVSAEVEETALDKVVSSFETYGGSDIQR